MEERLSNGGGATLTGSAANFPRPSGLPEFVTLSGPLNESFLVAHARLLGGQIDVGGTAADANVAALASASGLTFIFRYGVAVTFASRAKAEATDGLDGALAQYIIDPATERETEIVGLAILAGGEDRIGPDGQVQLADASAERLLLVATVLARSVVMSRDEVLVSEAFDRVAPIVSNLHLNGRVRLPIRRVMRLIGNFLAARHRVMGTVQANEHPDLLWDHPSLDRLYARLEAEYELNERTEALVRKFSALGDFTDVLLNIVQDKRAFRLEATIIMLIVFEILLSLFKLAVP